MNKVVKKFISVLVCVCIIIALFMAGVIYANIGSKNAFSKAVESASKVKGSGISYCCNQVGVEYAQLEPGSYGIVKMINGNIIFGKLEKYSYSEKYDWVTVTFKNEQSQYIVPFKNFAYLLVG